MEPRATIIFLGLATDGSGSAVKIFLKIYFNMEPRLKIKKNFLAAKILIFILTWNHA